MNELEKISDYVFHHAAHSPQSEALVWNENRITYAEFAQQIESISRALLAAGVKKGDRIAMLGSPRPEFWILLLATADIGAIWLGLHPRYQLPEFDHVIQQAQPKIVFGFAEIDGRDYTTELETLNQNHDCIEKIVFYDNPETDFGAKFDTFISKATQIDDDKWLTARSQVSTDDTAVIIFTSGSTGRPKGAMIKHYGLVHCAHIELTRWPSENLRLLQNMPINHIANIGMMSSYALVNGGTMVFMDRFDPEHVLQVIERENITFWLQAPTMFHLAVTHPKFENYDISSLQYIIWAGSPMPQDLVEHLYQLGATLATAYGMTELTAYATYSDLYANIEVLANSIGKPEPRYQLRLHNDAGEIPAVGERGEIQARGRWLMNGYFNQPDATREAFTEDGWFKTGDVAELRDDGNWRMVGRTKEMFKSGGFNIYPREIEIAIEEHADVAMAAVIGISDPVYFEVGYAFVQPMPGRAVDTDDLDKWCRQRLANYKVPKTFEILDELPKLPIGKIDKQKLKNMLS